VAPSPRACRRRRRWNVSPRFRPGSGTFEYSRGMGLIIRHERNSSALTQIEVPAHVYKTPSTSPVLIDTISYVDSGDTVGAIIGPQRSRQSGQPSGPQSWDFSSSPDSRGQIILVHEGTPYKRSINRAAPHPKEGDHGSFQSGGRPVPNSLPIRVEKKKKKKKKKRSRLLARGLRIRLHARQRGRGSIGAPAHD